MPVNGQSSVSIGRWAQVTKKWQATVYPIQSPSFVPQCDTISAYALPERSKLPTVWSPLLCLDFVPTSRHAYTPAKPGSACFLKHAWPLPHPCPQVSRCQKRSPPASSAVKIPLTLMAHFRPGIPWSLFPGPHHCARSLHGASRRLVCAAVLALVPVLLMLRALVNSSDLVSYSVEDGACVTHIL